MVKGIPRKVILIKSPDPKVFDEAIFIVRDDALRKAITQEEIIREAQETANKYIEQHVQKKLISRIPPQIFTLFGAGAVGIVWALSSIV